MSSSRAVIPLPVFGWHLSRLFAYYCGYNLNEGFTMLPSIRQTNLIIFLGCVGLMLIAAYMEHVMGLEPCPLCITQRAFVILVGLIALIAFLHNPARIGQRVYGILGILAAVIGGSFSSRQLWLQSLPEDQVPACGPGLSYMFDVYPFLEALEVLLRGDGNCAKVDWSLFGISIAGWTLVAFIGLAAINLFQTW